MNFLKKTGIKAEKPIFLKSKEQRNKENKEATEAGIIHFLRILQKGEQFFDELQRSTYFYENVFKDYREEIKKVKVRLSPKPLPIWKDFIKEDGSIDFEGFRKKWIDNV